jgi:glycosyltransferase involved in cell wall biosynthesis
MSKRLVGVSMAKNEADIVETFVRHNLRFVDHLVVLDDSSTDATPRILRALAEEGLSVSLVSVRQPDPVFRQGQRTTALAHDAFTQHAADYVFPLDADEFIRAPSREVLLDALESTDSEVASFRWPTYVPKDDGGGHPLRSLRWRVEVERAPLPKIVLSKRVMESANWRIGRGNHVLYRQVGKDLNWNTGENLPDVDLCHLPFRSPEQLTAKALVGWLARKLAYGPNSTSNSWHFRELFQRVQAGDPVTMTDVRDYAIGIYALGCVPSAEKLAQVTLVEDPIADPMPLRYTPDKPVDPTQLLAAWTALLVDHILQSAEQRAIGATPERVP